MIDSTDLDFMRDAVERLMPSTAYILSVAYTSDGQGGLVEAWGTAGTAACRLDYTSGREYEAGNAVKNYTGWMLTLPHDTAIAVTNRVQVNSATYAVISIDTPKSWNACIRAKLEAV